ncbi:hemagglutinin repeat-containing protein [Plesiomonas shigelloides subsp. oncorhynchi]|nr:hemagglutinin repeat-containing protein [Plesiomonas shigelloides]
MPVPTDVSGGGSLNLGYASNSQDGGQSTQITAGNNLNLHSAQDLSAQGTDLQAGHNAELRSDQGSVSLSGSQSQQNAQGGNIELALNANRKQTPAADNAVTGAAPSTAGAVSKVVKAGSGSVKLDGNLHRETRQHNSSVQAANVTIDSAQDTRLQNSSVKASKSPSLAAVTCNSIAVKIACWI